MMQKIRDSHQLAQFIEETCCENEVCVSVDESIDRESYVILKVDKFYNSLPLEFRPPSVDCLIVRECVDGGYGLTLIELKKTTTSQKWDLENVIEKFETTLFDFISKRFHRELWHDYHDVKLFFVTNKELYRRDLGLKMETLINVRFSFNNKRLMIIPHMPTPAIKRCYA